jgi:hypothetical protein
MIVELAKNMLLLVRKIMNSEENYE